MSLHSHLSNFLATPFSTARCEALYVIVSWCLPIPLTASLSPSPLTPHSPLRPSFTFTPFLSQPTLPPLTLDAAGVPPSFHPTMTVSSQPCSPAPALAQQCHCHHQLRRCRVRVRMCAAHIRSSTSNRALLPKRRITRTLEILLKEYQHYQ